MFSRTKTFIQAWNYLRVSKLWQNFHFWVNYPFKLGERSCSPVTVNIIHPHRLSVHLFWQESHSGCRVTGSVEVDVEYPRAAADLGPAEGRVNERKHQMSSWVVIGTCVSQGPEPFMPTEKKYPQPRETVHYCECYDYFIWQAADHHHSWDRLYHHKKNLPFAIFCFIKISSDIFHKEKFTQEWKFAENEFTLKQPKMWMKSESFNHNISFSSEKVVSRLNQERNMDPSLKTSR